MLFRSFLAHSTLALVLIALLFAIQFGLGSLDLPSVGLFPILLIAAVALPAAVAIASKLGSLTILGSAAAALVSASVAWVWLLLALRNIALPVQPETTLWQVASYNGPGPLLRLWALLSAAAVAWLLLLRRRTHRS